MAIFFYQSAKSWNVLCKVSKIFRLSKKKWLKNFYILESLLKVQHNLGASLSFSHARALFIWVLMQMSKVSPPAGTAYQQVSKHVFMFFAMPPLQKQIRGVVWSLKNRGKILTMFIWLPQNCKRMTRGSLAFLSNTFNKGIDAIFLILKGT